MHMSITQRIHAQNDIRPMIRIYGHTPNYEAFDAARVKHEGPSVLMSDAAAHADRMGRFFEGADDAVFQARWSE